MSPLTEPKIEAFAELASTSKLMSDKMHMNRIVLQVCMPCLCGHERVQASEDSLVTFLCEGLAKLLEVARRSADCVRLLTPIGGPGERQEEHPIRVRELHQRPIGNYAFRPFPLRYGCTAAVVFTRNRLKNGALRGMLMCRLARAAGMRRRHRNCQRSGRKRPRQQ